MLGYIGKAANCPNGQAHACVAQHTPTTVAPSQRRAPTQLTCNLILLLFYYKHLTLGLNLTYIPGHYHIPTTGYRCGRNHRARIALHRARIALHRARIALERKLKKLQDHSWGEVPGHNIDIYSPSFGNLCPELALLCSIFHYMYRA